mgnify:CR=1 FL=1
MKIEPGWLFLSADFSVQCMREGTHTGVVMLIRDRLGREEWHKLSDEEQDINPLYATGRGLTLESAIKNANKGASKAGPIPRVKNDG